MKRAFAACYDVNTQGLKVSIGGWRSGIVVSSEAGEGGNAVGEVSVRGARLEDMEWIRNSIFREK